MLYPIFMNVGLFVAFLAVESPHKAWGDVDLLGDASSFEPAVSARTTCATHRDGESRLRRHIFRRRARGRQAAPPPPLLLLLPLSLPLGESLPRRARALRWGTVVARNALTLAAADETLPTWPIIASLCAIRGAALCYAAGASCVFAGMALATGGTTGEEGGTVAYAKLGVAYYVLTIIAGTLVQLATLTVLGRNKWLRPILLSGWMFAVYASAAETPVLLTNCLRGCRVRSICSMASAPRRRRRKPQLGARAPALVATSLVLYKYIEAERRLRGDQARQRRPPATCATRRSSMCFAFP